MQEGATQRWVLDTNAVLDWLVFDDASMRAPAARLHAGMACWAHTGAMLDELADVVSREVITRRAGAAPAELLARVEQARAAHGLLLPTAARCAWNCADADDQMFIDLAVHARASLLITRDKALLALARRAAACGLRIARPAEWMPEAGFPNGTCAGPGLRPAAAGAATTR